jgi:hypothetical protein
MLGVVSTLAGSGDGTSKADGLGTLAAFMQPLAVAVNLGGEIYIADYKACNIRKIDRSGLLIL